MAFDKLVGTLESLCTFKSNRREMNYSRLKRATRLLPMIVGGALLCGSTFALGILAATGAQASRGDWLSFAGALLGAAITIAGSISVLEWQRAQEERERRTLLLELLADVDEACVPFQLANQPALQARYGTTAVEQVRKVQATIGRVRTFCKTFQPKTVQMIKAVDTLSSLDFGEDALETELRSIRFYPDSADFGSLNARGHEVMGVTGKARDILEGRD